jgi:hypothetical protein
MEQIKDPKKLDAQCKIKISRWVDLHSDECKIMDDNYALTKKMYKMLFGKEMFVDFSGRIWGGGRDGFYPFHFEYNGALVGYKISKLASN